MINIYRIAHLLWKMKIPLFPRFLYIINRILFAVVLPPSVYVGRDALFAYSGLATVIHARCVLGDRVKIGQGVTVGGRAGIFAVPVIEDDVEIGSGAKVIGPIIIGRGAKVGANAVVLHSVPAGATVVGIPARIIATSFVA